MTALGTASDSVSEGEIKCNEAEGTEKAGSPLILQHAVLPLTARPLGTALTSDAAEA